MLEKEEKKEKAVLILDDDKFLSDMYAVKFKEKGFNVATALDGDEALEKLKEGPEPDVVLLDLVMSDMDGFEFLKRAKNEKLTKDSKFIILSNLGQESDVKKGKDLGADGYIIKAKATPSEVVQYVTEIIDK
ncbi:MAG: response regulator [Candidatus Pacebacteria bacterium]|nr:response regulator [Candidatus Paceibacterota bacterium]